MGIFLLQENKIYIVKFKASKILRPGGLMAPSPRTCRYLITGNLYNMKSSIEKSFDFQIFST